MGPIYRVRCNPYWHPNDCPIFITCSYDWTVRVWHEKDSDSKLTCHQIGDLQQQVNDICWSPSTSSVFASVANDGRVEIWDLKKDSLAPQLTHYDRTVPPPFDPKDDSTKIKTPKTVVKFSRASPVVLTGSIDGQVGVYRTYGLDHGPVSD